VFAVEFREVFLHEEAVDGAGVFGVEGKVVDVFELLDDEALEFLLGEGFGIEKLGVFGESFVGFALEVGEGGEELALVFGRVLLFKEAFVKAGVFGVLLVFGPDESIFAFEFAGAFEERA